jgi:hypothetical protein
MALRHASPIAAIAGVLVISACGSSKEASHAAIAPARTATGASAPASSSSAALEPAFIARADAVCARAKTRLDARGPFPYQNFDALHPDVKLLRKIGAFFAGGRSIADRVPVELGQLGTPGRAQTQWREMLALAREDRAIGDRQITAADASDAAGFVATVNAIHATDTKLQTLAHLSGFSESSPCKAIF